MAISVLGPINKVVNDTTTEIISSDITGKIVGVLTTFISSSFNIMDETLKKIQDLTKEEPSP